jgi:hypothetical protein
MHLGGITASPTGEWTVPQARNLALGPGERVEGIRFLIRDRGPNLTASFDAVFQAAGTRILRTAVQAPRMNAICERLVGTLRRELLDRVLILGNGICASSWPSTRRTTTRPGRTRASPSTPPTMNLTLPRHSDRHRHGTDPPETCPGRPDQRVHARRLITEDLQVTSTILFSSGTPLRNGT